MKKLYQAIGLMSGTSMDGIDLALIESDGKEIIERKKFSYQPYSDEFRNRLKKLIFSSSNLEEIKILERDLTLLHAEFVNNFLQENKISRNEIDLIGFHGHTIFHNPKEKITWQIGDSHLLEKETGIKVISGFRNMDIALGGQGAPLVPIYHFYLFFHQPKPAIILNIGGISNLTYLENSDENSIQAFDVCFGNAPLDDLVKKKLGLDYDKDGLIARSGKVNLEMANQILQAKIFNSKPPKSFDRNDFAKEIKILDSLEIANSLATMNYIHAKVLKKNLEFLPQKISTIFVCGGGRKNLALIDEIKNQLDGIEVKNAEDENFNGDAVEAEAFAFLAIRVLLNLPISFPKTTGRKI